MKYSLVGLGKMSTAVDEAATRLGHQRVGGVSRLANEPAIADQIGVPDVVFEFTAPGAGPRHVQQLVDAGLKVVCGTTGWEVSEDLATQLRASSAAALVHAANFSIGMTLFRRGVRALTREASTRHGYLPTLEEVHHLQKLDRPSGTALRLADDIVANDPALAGWRFSDDRVDDTKLSIHVERIGATPGTHRVRFSSPDDTITMEHCAHGRSGFARGAVAAGEYLLGRTGLHDFEQVLEA
ncbi:MAG: hypothetical protein OEV00_07115 [Acidobacteriota bacterium]|nr:hypothetical protein [Acidobacteriota bacterium]MDH3785082.1 hypothetical protein [Acidobacteriota bacterium]